MLPSPQLRALRVAHPCQAQGTVFRDKGHLAVRKFLTKCVGLSEHFGHPEDRPQEKTNREPPWFPHHPNYRPRKSQGPSVGSEA